LVRVSWLRQEKTPSEGPYTGFNTPPPPYFHSFVVEVDGTKSMGRVTGGAVSHVWQDRPRQVGHFFGEDLGFLVPSVQSVRGNLEVVGHGARSVL
jgi:hypothetical protein